MTDVRKIAVSDDGAIAFWTDGRDVYRVTGTCPGMDTYGLPMGRRWECSLEHWPRMVAVYAWVRPLEPTGDFTLPMV